MHENWPESRGRASLATPESANGPSGCIQYLVRMVVNCLTSKVPDTVRQVHFWSVDGPCGYVYPICYLFSLYLWRLVIWIH